MKQIPKYDRNEVEPLSLKPALSQLYNTTLAEEWMGSQFKDRIIIGFHNIKCSGAILQSRYRETWSGKFDGIHNCPQYFQDRKNQQNNSVLFLMPTLV